MKSIVYVLSVLMFSCAENQTPAEHKEDISTHAPELVTFSKEQFERVGIKLGRVEMKNIRSVVRANGFLKVPPQNQADISIPVGGIVQSIVVREGDFVAKDDTVAWLRHPDYIKLQEDYLITKSRLIYLDGEYNRSKSLSASQFESEKNLQEIASAYLAERARSLSLAQQLELINIPLNDVEEGNFARSIPLLSPIAGSVTKILSSIGMYADPEKPILQVVDNSHVHVDLLIYEKDIFRIRPGQTVHFVLTNQNNREIDGVVFSVSKAFENDSKSLAVHADIKNPAQHGLIPGMFVNALIEVDSSRSPCLPSAAIVDVEGKKGIFVLHESEAVSFSFRFVEVKTGEEDLGLTEIVPLGEFSETAQVVVEGAYYVKSKMIQSDDEGHGH